MRTYAEGDLLIDDHDDEYLVLEVWLTGTGWLYTLGVRRTREPPGCEFWLDPESARKMLHVPGGDLGARVR